MQNPLNLSGAQLIEQIWEAYASPMTDEEFVKFAETATKPKTTIQLGKYGYGVRTYGLRKDGPVDPAYVGYDEIVWC